MNYRYITVFTVPTIALLLAGCAPRISGIGGGGSPVGGWTYQSAIQKQNAVVVTSMTTPGNIPNGGSANYSGVAEFWTKSAFQDFFGDFNGTVRFGTGKLTAKIDNMSVVGSGIQLDPVSGSVDVAGNVTGNNSFLADAFTGSYSGTIDGIAANGTVDGNFRGTSAGLISLGFNGINFLGGAWAD